MNCKLKLYLSLYIILLISDMLPPKVCEAKSIFKNQSQLGITGPFKRINLKIIITVSGDPSYDRPT